MNGFYFVCMSLIGFACAVLGWDAEHGVALYQVSILLGGVLLGHVITEALNEQTNQGDE